MYVNVQEFAEKMRFSNHIKRLDDDEIEFLSSTAMEQRRKQADQARQVKQELEAFREASKELSMASSIPSTSSSTTTTTTTTTTRILPISSSDSGLNEKRLGLVKGDVQRSVLGSLVVTAAAKKRKSLGTDVKDSISDKTINTTATTNDTPADKKAKLQQQKQVSTTSSAVGLLSGYGSSGDESD